MAAMSNTYVCNLVLRCFVKVVAVRDTERMALVVVSDLFLDRSAAALAHDEQEEDDDDDDLAEKGCLYGEMKLN